MGSSSGFFDGSNVDKSESLLLDESVEKRMELYLIYLIV